MPGYNLPDNVSPNAEDAPWNQDNNNGDWLPVEEANAEIFRLQEELQELTLRLAGLQGKYNYLVSVCRVNKILPPIY